jgi:hypothetical protein
MPLQQFLNEFAFYKLESVYSQLINDPRFILHKAMYNSCPQQLNGYKHFNEDLNKDINEDLNEEEDDDYGEKVSQQ